MTPPFRNGALQVKQVARSAEPAAILIHARGPRARLPESERATWSRTVAKTKARKTQA